MEWVTDEFTGIVYPATTIKTKDICYCETTHNSIEISSNKCNNCNKKIENENTSTT